MKKKELDRIEKLYSQASLEPWQSFVEGRDHTSGSDFIMVGKNQDRKDDIELTGATHADQDFIASARSDVPTLVMEVRKLKAKLKKAKKK